MRIISGVAKGRELKSPHSDGVRPTSDRAREGLFSTLESEFGSIEGLRFLDLFAGSGAVGVEALSRGAIQVHSVELDVETADVARANFASVPSSAECHVYRESAEKFLESGPASNGSTAYDIIFMDPPYNVTNEVIERLLTLIIERDLLQPRGLVAIERDSKGKVFTWPQSPRAMAEVKVRSYGQGSIYYGGYSDTV